MGELALEPVHLVQHVFFPQMGIHIENLHPNLLLSERPETRARCSARRNSKPVSFDQTAADGWGGTWRPADNACWPAASSTRTSGRRVKSWVVAGGPASPMSLQSRAV